MAESKKKKAATAPAAKESARLEAPTYIGPPGRLRMAAVAGVEELGAPIKVQLPAALKAYVDERRPTLRIGRDARRSRMRLAPQTPPGTYQVAVEFDGGQQRDVAITVEPRDRIRIHPATFRLEGAPGEAVSAQLLIENRGNLPLEIGDALVSGLFENGGIEAALAAVYRLDTDNLNKAAEIGFARLREAHGGLLKLRVTEGAGTIAPGEYRRLLLETTLGSKLAPGHGYHGTLELGCHRIAVRVSVNEASKTGARK